MKAVADQLGVDRKALHHHVGDRDALLGLIAVDIFTRTFSPVKISEHARWQDACRAYAHGITDSAIAVGAFADHLRLERLLATTMLETTEALLAKFRDAGFDDDFAVRSLALLSNICVAFARDVGLVTRSGDRPRRLLLQDALADNASQAFENLRRIAAISTDTYDMQQIEHSIEVFILGTEQLLAHSPNGVAQADENPARSS